MATAQDVHDRARTILNDPSKVHWTDAELFRWISDALDLMARGLPSLFTKTTTHTCIAGALQTLAVARAMSLVRVIGVPVCDRASLDAFLPGWRTLAGAAAANWMPGESGPKSFLVYPPSLVGQQLPVDYVEAPAEITALTDSLPVSDDHVGVLADYVIGMSEAKDAEHVNSGRAALFLQSFVSKLGIKS